MKVRMEGNMVEIFEVGPCENAYQMGFLIGQRFSNLIRSRLARDLILQNQLLPFAGTPESRSFIKALWENNQNKFPGYWDELLGTAAGSGVPVIEVMLMKTKAKLCCLCFVMLIFQSHYGCSFADYTYQLQKGDTSIHFKD